MLDELSTTCGLIAFETFHESVDVQLDAFSAMLQEIVGPAWSNPPAGFISVQVPLFVPPY